MISTRALMLNVPERMLERTFISLNTLNNRVNQIFFFYGKCLTINKIATYNENNV